MLIQKLFYSRILTSHKVEGFTMLCCALFLLRITKPRRFSMPILTKRTNAPHLARVGLLSMNNFAPQLAVGSRAKVGQPFQLIQLQFQFFNGNEKQTFFFLIFEHDLGTIYYDNSLIITKVGCLLTFLKTKGRMHKQYFSPNPN